MTCTADSDCGEGEVCYTADVSDCAMATTPCEIDDEGFVVCDEDQSDNAECESEMISFCIARHYLACENDADCGEGFTCHAIEICECQGGGESSPGSDDAPQPEPEENCQCESADEGYCELQEIPCASDEACPSGLVCVFSSAGGATDSACAVDSNGNESCPTEPERDTSDEEPAGEDGLGFCAPPGGYGENSPQPGAPGSNSDSNTDEPRAEGDDDAAEVPTTQDDAETEPDDEAETGSFWMLNCSASQGPTALWLLLVSLFLVRVRRSRRS